MGRSAGKSSFVVAAIVLLALFYGLRDTDVGASGAGAVETAQATPAEPAGGPPVAAEPPDDESGLGSHVGNRLADSLVAFVESLGSSDGDLPPAQQGDWTVDVASAKATLEEIEVKGKAPKTGYSRSFFGRAWDDSARVEYGGNGCDQRSDVLGYSLTEKVMRDECIVESGTLHGPYTGKIVGYTRDRTPDVDIDHRVALAHAYQTGAQQWPTEKRLAFANDPRNLVAVDASANRQKGDADAATWLPPNKAYRCTYVAAQIDVKATYGLWVTQPEKDAMLHVLGQC